MEKQTKEIMSSSINKWYIILSPIKDHPTGGFVRSYKIHWFYRLLIKLRIKEEPKINPLDLFSKQN